MGTSEDFITKAGDLLKDRDWQLVDASSGDSLSAIRDLETTVMVRVFTEELGDGTPIVVIRSAAVTNFQAPESDRRLEFLEKLNELNAKLWFGVWYFVPDVPAVVLDHSLLANHLTPEEFLIIVELIEQTADIFDDQLSDFLGGETAQETLVREYEKINRFRTSGPGPGSI